MKHAFVCTFAGCRRRFADKGSYTVRCVPVFNPLKAHTVAVQTPLQLHARTHTDGEFASYKPSKAQPGEAGTETSTNPLTVVFHGPMEHHSNILPWREAPNSEHRTECIWMVGHSASLDSPPLSFKPSWSRPRRTLTAG